MPKPKLANMLKLMMVVSLTIQMSNNKPNKLKVLKALIA
jgi:hypothetical protein